MNKKRIKIVSLFLAVILFCYSITDFYFVDFKKDDSIQNNSFNSVVAEATEAVVTEVVSDVLLTILASLGVTAGTAVSLNTNQAQYTQEQYEKYIAENTTGVRFVLDGVSYNIKHPDGVSSLTDSFAEQIQEAISSSPEAAAEFEKLIEAVQSGAEITGGMLKNLWLMLAKGVVDDYNASVEDLLTHQSGVWKAEYDIYKYTNWCSEMQDVYNAGYTNYVFYLEGNKPTICLFSPNTQLGVYDDGTGAVLGFQTNAADYYVFQYLTPGLPDYSVYFPNDISSGWYESLKGYSEELEISKFYRIDKYKGYTPALGDFVGMIHLAYHYTIEFINNDITDRAFEFPVDNTVDVPLPGDTTEDVPYVVNPSDVITDIPEKIVNDEPITIPDDTTLEDVVSDPSVPVGIVGELVSVGDIDFPWENEDVINPDVDTPDLPTVDLPNWLDTLLEWLQKIIDAINSLVDGIVNGILEGLKDLFIPDANFFNNNFNKIKDELSVKLGYMDFIDMLDDLQYCVSGNWNFRISGLSFYHHSFDVVDVSDFFTDENLNKLHMFIRGFLYPLIILGDINFILWFFRGTSLSALGSVAKKCE